MLPWPWCLKKLFIVSVYATYDTFVRGWFSQEEGKLAIPGPTLVFVRLMKVSKNMKSPLDTVSFPHHWSWVLVVLLLLLLCFIAASISQTKLFLPGKLYLSQHDIRKPKTITLCNLPPRLQVTSEPRAAVLDAGPKDSWDFICSTVHSGDSNPNLYWSTRVALLHLSNNLLKSNRYTIKVVISLTATLPELTLVPLTVRSTANMNLWSWGVKGSSSKFCTHAFHSCIVIKSTVRDGGERGGRRKRQIFSLSLPAVELRRASLIQHAESIQTGRGEDSRNLPMILT